MFFFSRKKAIQPNPHFKKNLDELNSKGWTVLEHVVPNATIDKLLQEVSEFRQKHGNIGMDERGFGKRIGLLHVENETSLSVAMNKEVVGCLEQYFQDEPVLFGTLTFDIGTEQSAHHDAAFFHTDRFNAMVGVWVALEDIHADAGPLFYIENSHVDLPLKAQDCLSLNDELAFRVKQFRSKKSKSENNKELADEVYRNWDRTLDKRILELKSIKKPALLKKGDAFVWHGWLVHGGSPRINPELSRKSMVSHYIARSSKMWHQYDFFLNGDCLSHIKPISFSYKRGPNGLYVKHKEAVIISTANGFYKA